MGCVNLNMYLENLRLIIFDCNILSSPSKDFKCVNDVAERFVKDMSEYASLTTDQDYREDIIHVAAARRKDFKSLTKKSLSNIA